MKNKQKNFTSIALLWLSLLSISFLSCSEEEFKNDEENYIYLSIDDKTVNKETSINVPYDGNSYNITIKVSPKNLNWNVSITGDNYLNISKNNGTGNSEIIISIPKLPDEISSRESKIIIQAEKCSTVYSIIFTQAKESTVDNELPLRFPKGTKGQNPEDFENPSSNFNIYNMVSTSHVALLWDKKFGSDPKNATSPYNFDPEKAVTEAQKCYDYIIDELHFSNRTTSWATKNKFIVFVNYELGTSATGGGSDGVPIINVKPQSLPNYQNGTYSILYHEMSHGFQFVAGWDNPESGIKTDGTIENTSHAGIYEYTSQWTVMNRFTNFADLQNNRFNIYMNNTHLAFPHMSNEYNAPYLLQYWNEKHSNSNAQYGEFISRLWKEYRKEDERDVIKTFKRITGLSQSDMMDEMWEAAAHNITWDLDLIRDDYDKYKNQHKTKLNRINAGEYQIDNNVCPQNYGYNAIKLDDYQPNTNIEIELKQVNNTELNVINPNLCDYRVGFMAYKSGGERIYSNPQKGNKLKTSFTVPDNTEFLWLIVLAGPSEHFWNIDYYKNSSYGYWPYTFTINGAVPDRKACGILSNYEEIDLTGKLTANAEYRYDQTVNETIDNDPDTFWQSQWSSSGTDYEENKYKWWDATYGAYIDINLKHKYNIINFAYQTRNSNNTYPAEIQLYGSSDGLSWTPLGKKLTRSEDNLPEEGKKWYYSEDYSNVGNYTKLRLSITKNYDEGKGVEYSLCDPEIHKAVCIAEFKLFGI